MTGRPFSSPYRLGLAVALAAMLWAVSPQPATAAAPASKPPSGITVGPFLQEVTLNPGAPTTSFNVDVSNHTKAAQDLVLSTVNFGTLNDTGGVAFSGLPENYTKKYGLAEWLSLDTSRVTLKSNESRKIKITVRNDDSLLPGGHYAAILFRQVATDSSGRQVDIQSTLSTLVFLTKKGGERYDLRLEGLQLNGNRFRAPDKATLRFSNPGNVYVTPRGTVRLESSNGTVVRRGIINEDSARVLPDSQRLMYVPMRSIGNLSWLPGHYKLIVDYRYDGIDDRYAHKEISVFLINIRSAALLLGGLAILAVLTYLLVRYRHVWLPVLRRHKDDA